MQPHCSQFAHMESCVYIEISHWFSSEDNKNKKTVIHKTLDRQSIDSATLTQPKPGDD